MKKYNKKITRKRILRQKKNPITDWENTLRFPEPKEFEEALVAYKDAVVTNQTAQEITIKKTIISVYKNLFNEYISTLWK